MKGLLLGSSNFWDTVKDIVAGLFAFIPQCTYFLYTSMASLLDFGQLLLRKLVGLDVYYIKDANTGSYVAKSGDILKDFVSGILGIDKSYSSLKTVFWSLIIFGVIVLILTTIFAIIKAQYNYDSEKSQPSKIIANSIKSLALMALTPLVIFFGVYMSEVIMQSLDQITNPSSNSNIEKVYESEAVGRLKKVNLSREGESVAEDSEDNYSTYYFSYDIFGIKEWTNMTTFSGRIFEMITHDANRVRLGDYTATQTVANSYWDNCGIFYTSQEGDVQEIVASQIDYAFSNTLTLGTSQKIAIKGKSEAVTVIGSTLTYGPSAGFSSGLINVGHFSKFNVGLVWYYYNLWNVNYIVGFGMVLTCGTLMLSLIIGLLKRLILCVALFVIQAPVIGISPLDGGNGFKEWKSKFLSYFIAGYGAVAGINIFFLILPVLESISFFNVYILDKLFDIIIILAGLSAISKMVQLISGFIGANDLEKEAKGTREDARNLAVEAGAKTIQTAGVGVQVGRYAMTGGVGQKLISKVNTAVKYKNGQPMLPYFSTGPTLRKKKTRKYNTTNAIYKMVNSTPGRMLMRYTGLSDADFVSDDREYRRQLESATYTDENGNVAHYSKEQIKQMMDERKVSAGKGILRGAGMNIADLGMKLGSALRNSDQLRPVLDQLVEKGVSDEAKMGVQTMMKGINMDTSIPESGRSEYLSTSKQQEKASKSISGQFTKDINESANQSTRTVGEISNLINILRRKG